MDNLLDELKDNLQITWEDAGTDRVLLKYIANGKRYFNELCEKEFIFEHDTRERELLLERCRYAWNNALNEFENDFGSDLQRLILKVALEQNAESEVSNESNVAESI